jgi:putative transposase
MARLARVVIPGLPHHAVHRAHPDVRLFRDQTDYARYQALLEQNCSRYKVELKAFCLMPDHVHLVLIPKSTDGLSRAVGETGRLYARGRGMGGAKLWRGRFQSCSLDKEHATAAIAYVVNNPIRARLGAWPWRSPKSVKSEASPHEIELIQKATKTGRPAGSPEFYARLEYDIGRALSPKKRGRKSKW